MNLFTISTPRGLAAALIFCLIGFSSLHAQNPPPALFDKECVGDPLTSGLLLAVIQINGEFAVEGEDYVAIFDSDGFVVGTAPIVSGNFAAVCTPESTGAIVTVSGVNGTITPDPLCPAGYGAVVGEVMTGLIYDGSTGLYYVLPGDLTFRTSPPILPGGANCTPVNATVLPVVLTAFRGEAVGPKHIRLSWDVAREENVSHYEVQRSTNGTDWHAIDAVTAVGNSEIPLNYYFDDLSPEGQRQFYRLRMVDLDGAEDFSGIVITELDQTGERTVNTFPNPASPATRLSIQLGGAWSPNAPINASLYDLNGRVVADYSSLSAGTSSVAIPGGAKSGLYLLRVTQANTVFTHKISLQ